MRRFRLSRLLPAAAIAFLPLTALAQTPIGVVGSSEPRLTGQAPGAGARTLSAGSAVVANDRIRSSAGGRAQLLFQDQTTLSISPNSEVLLDRFVYDPDRRRGEIGVRLTRGTLRFIGGLTTRRSEGVILTPTATVGVRGSTALVRHLNGETLAVFLSGKRLCLRGAGPEACTNRRGGVLGEGGYLGRISDAALAAMLADLDGAAPDRLVRRGGLGDGNRGDPREGPFGSDGSRRDGTTLDDRLGTETDLGLVPGNPPEPMLPDEPMPPYEPMEPEIDREDDFKDQICEFDGDEEFCFNPA